MSWGEWFDPYNFEHLDAYRHLQKTGNWPEEFISKYISGYGMFESLAKKTMVDAWIELTATKTPEEIKRLKRG